MRSEAVLAAYNVPTIYEIKENDSVEPVIHVVRPISLAMRDDLKKRT